MAVFKMLSYYMNATYALIIPMVFIILSCHEKVCDSKEFSRNNSK